MLKMEIISAEKANEIIQTGGLNFILFEGDQFEYDVWYEWRGVELSEDEICQICICAECLVWDQALIVDYE